MDAKERAELEALKQNEQFFALKLKLIGDQMRQCEGNLQQAHVLLEGLRVERQRLIEAEGSFKQRLYALERAALAENAVAGEILTGPPVMALPPRIDEMAGQRMETAPVIETPPNFEQEISPPEPELASAKEAPSTNTVLPPLVTAASADARKGSFEMRLGTYWLVRIGVVMLLSGMVFLGNYAYKTFIARLGPAGKVSLLYFASGLLLGAGSWLGRKEEKLKNFAQVLFAGGLAAVYFTTYAAYHIPALKIFSSAVLDGTLLLGWAGFMVWIATKKQSEVLALFAVGLGYYTAVITHVGLFTLYSNLLLTVAAVFFLVRNRWATLTFGSLVASYAAYGFWRFFHNGNWHWATPEEGLWTGTYFLMSYWLLYTAAVFLSRHEQFKNPNRTVFLSLNNAAFFFLFLLTMLQVRQGGFWRFSLSYGLALLVLALLAARTLKEDRVVSNAYLSLGLLLVTLGFITKYTGLRLGLVLAVESVALLLLGRWTERKLLSVAAHITAVLSAAWVLWAMDSQQAEGLYQGCGVGALLLFNALWRAPEQQRKSWEVSSLFICAGLAVWFRTTWVYSAPESVSALLGVEALVLTFSFYCLRSKALSLLGQLFLIVGAIQCISNLLPAVFPRELPNAVMLPWWNPALVAAISLGLAHWWQRQKTMDLDPQARLTLQSAFSLAVVCVLFLLLKPHFSDQRWMLMSSLVAVAITVYGLLSRLWPLAGFGQLFVAASVAEFVRQLYVVSSGNHQTIYFMAPVLVPAALASVFSYFTQKKFPEHWKPGEGFALTVLFYQIISAFLALGWINEFVAARERFWVLETVAAFFFVLAGALRSLRALGFFAGFALAGFLLLGTNLYVQMIYWPNLVAIILLLAEERVAARMPDRFHFQPWMRASMIVVGGLEFWLFTSRWVLLHASGFYLTATWSAVGFVLFFAGFVFLERTYRWLGLGVLACALGRVVFVDLWKLEVIYRVLSFMALGLVLIALGFIYNKYQEKIREWL